MVAIDCNDTNFESEALNSDVPVLVDFWAPWCGPCKAMSPIIDEIANEYAGRLTVLKVSIDDAPGAAAKFGVTSIPNFSVVKDGEIKTQLAGVRPKQALIAAFSPHLN